LDASKVAFVEAVRWLEAKGIRLVDCQVATEHLARFGAREIPRDDFLARLDRALQAPTLRGRWSLETGVRPIQP
jgi:leucyl/phenylalanyl-tRNA--protein transferase